MCLHCLYNTSQFITKFLEVEVGYICRALYRLRRGGRSPSFTRGQAWQKRNEVAVVETLICMGDIFDSTVQLEDQLIREGTEEGLRYMS